MKGLQTSQGNKSNISKTDSRCNQQKDEQFQESDIRIV